MHYDAYWELLIERVKDWFDHEGLTHAVVGFSGGVDSATTIALLAHSHIPTHIVLANAPNQRRESNFDPYEFAKIYNHSDHKLGYIRVAPMVFEMPQLVPYDDMATEMDDPAKEAALPILRNACFYGLAALLRDLGEKPIVVGTANFDEAAYLGFWGKASDAAQDFYPISHLHKSEVRRLARFLNVPEEIINATPSGDLLYSGELNDYKMIGATYKQIEFVARFVDNPKSKTLKDVVSYIEENVDNPELFCDNITRNKFKYDIPFGQKHVSERLEHFRRNYYPMILQAARTVKAKYAQSKAV